jgi:signal transduction histidine kinase
LIRFIEALLGVVDADHATAAATPRRRRIARSSGQPIGRDCRPFTISRSADDTARGRVYGGAVSARTIRLGRLRVDAARLDWALAAALTLLLEIELWVTGPAHDTALLAVVCPPVTLAVAVRRRFPAAVGIGAGLLADLVAATVGPPNFLSYGVAWMCCMYAFAVWARPRAFWLGILAIAAGGLASALEPGANVHATVQFVVVSTVVILLVHRLVGERERRAQMAERERDLASREAVVEERARIARELHDVIAHHVSMMVLQAGAERRALEQAGGDAEVLETIERTGRSALTETRRLLGMLRADGEEPLAPQPRLADVPLLIGQVREAGLPVELEVEGEPRELSAGVELSAYRIVQEALTNALKHAGDAHARVSIRYRPQSIEIEVADDGAGEADASRSGGHGLVGMRERVALYGGRFTARRAPEGGFVVHVSLPVA